LLKLSSLAQMKSLIASEKPRLAGFVTQQKHITLEAREVEYELLLAAHQSH